MKPAALRGAACVWLASASALAQTPAPPEPRPVTRTIYMRNTELFAEWPPLIVGQPTPLIAHVTHTGERFRAYTDGTVRLTLSVEGAAVNTSAGAPEQPGVFRLTVTPTKVGNGHMVIDVEASGVAQHFTIDDVPVYPDIRAALAREAPDEAGLIRYAKEQSWKEDFSTAPVTVLFPGAGSIVAVPASAIIRDSDTTHVYVQRTPEQFEWREVRTRRTIGNTIEVTSGLRAGERIVVVGADRMPRPN